MSDQPIVIDTTPFPANDNLAYSVLSYYTEDGVPEGCTEARIIGPGMPMGFMFLIQDGKNGIKETQAKICCIALDRAFKAGFELAGVK